MRDAERLRERLELSLDTPQVAALLVGALLLLGGVFTVGLMIGRRTAAASPAPYGDLTALDARARRIDPPPEKRVVEPPRPAEPSVVAQPPVAAATVVTQPQQRPLQVAPVPAAVPLTAPPHDPGAYTVQIGSSQDRDQAARLEARARGAGLKPYVVSADLGAKGTWFRVRVGAFRDRDAANRFQKDVERELRTAAVVMPTH